MSEKKGQGAFEYLMSYGWAILIVIVLGIVLWNLGVFNPNTTPEASGFTLLRPTTWEFTGAATQSLMEGPQLQAKNTTEMTYVTIALQNVAGIDLILEVTSNRSIEFKKPGSGKCKFYIEDANPKINVSAVDEQDNELKITNDAVAVPAGSIVILRGWLNSTEGGCGGLSKAPYRYTISTVSKDAFMVQHTDTGFITGRYT